MFLDLVKYEILIKDRNQLRMPWPFEIHASHLCTFQLKSLKT